MPSPSTDSDNSSEGLPSKGLLEARVLLKSDLFRRWRALLREVQADSFRRFLGARSNEERLWAQAEATILNHLLGPLESRFLDQEGLDMQPQGQVASGLMDEDLPYQGEDEQ